VKKGSYKDYADLLRQLDTKRLAKGKEFFSLTGIYIHGQKALGQYCNIHIFLSFLGSLIKQFILFEIFLQFSLPPTLYEVETRKTILDTRVQHCLWDEGRGWTCVNWKTPKKCKSVPRLSSMNVVVWNERWRRILHTVNRLPWETAFAFLIVPRSLPRAFWFFLCPVSISKPINRLTTFFPGLSLLKAMSLSRKLSGPW